MVQAHEFRADKLAPGGATTVTVDGVVVAVYNIDGVYFAIEDTCPHGQGPLSEGVLEGSVINCPWHGACFDVRTGAVLLGPATEPVQIYEVTVEDGIGRVIAM